MEILGDSLSMLARLDVMVALLIGSVGGVIIGAIPGVGPAIAIAILLPATYALEPLVGLTLLLGIYGSAMFGGAIPAILINTPGTPVNALTTYDGYPMTRAGEPQRALALAFGASFVGGVFSVIVLMLLAPVLAEVAPLFGSREIFLATLLGMILVVLAHRGQYFAAAALLFLGIFLQTIGLESVRYTQRYTFDQSWLTKGVNLIVVVLGLFAISQAFLLLTGKDDTPRPPRLKGGLFAGLREVLRLPKFVLPGAGYGTAMGIIPGVGEFTAQFLSYTTAQRLSKTPERFGKGAPEGLVASESANNAVPAAAMVPLLALGIPGEALTAMMLSVFYVHNVIPGPTLFQTRMDFVLALYLCLLALNVLALVFLIVATRPLLRVVAIPNRFLGMAILILSFVGVYSLRNSATDCAMAAGFGLLGLILKRLNLPIVPIILGMVLGGIMEAKFRTSLARIREPWDWINRPIAGAIFALIVLVILAHLIPALRKRRKA
ncbi:MAG: tripartite tricarboxylate transporter permease [Pseudomonadota bacterium]